MGIIFTILGIYTIYQLWSVNVALAIIVVIATLYQASSLNELFKERRGHQPKDKWQTTINMFSTITIIILFLLSFFL